MKVPISWLKDFIDINIPIEELAHRLTLAGLEVEEIRYLGLPLPEGKTEDRSGGHLRPETKTSGIAWASDKIVVGAVLEVMPHPNADRLVLCRLDDGEQEHIVLTGAPNLFPYKGKGKLSQPLKVAYAREGAKIYDGHQPGQVITTLKRTIIRGVESYSMICSEKELGISDEHEGVIILDDDAPIGQPLVEYMGDAVLNISIIPNIARAASIYGVAREVAALTGARLRPPELTVVAEGPSIDGKVSIQITEPELNPRFVLGLIEGIDIRPSPYWVQLRLRLAGMRPIDNIVDATNYAMLELGEPLHAFDYDLLVQRARGHTKQPSNANATPTIITRRAQPGEKLTTLDGVERTLDDFTMLVCDTAGALSIAGVMGGAESEVSTSTRNVLLEGASWNYINIRRTINAQNLPSEAAYRFERGVHPELASQGVLRGLELMRQWAGGKVARGLVDNYALPHADPTVEITTQDVTRWLGVELSLQEITDILERLQFTLEVRGQIVYATSPPHRLDIGQGTIGKADLVEEIARIYGYDKIPETRMADELPPQWENRSLTIEKRIRDLLVDLGLQEIITHRLTSPEREARRLPPEVPTEDVPYFRLTNPISSDRTVLRHSLLSSMLETIERNSRLRERIALFEIGPVYLPSEDSPLPEEANRLLIALTGPRMLAAWQGSDTNPMDFYDLKGILDSLLVGLHLKNIGYKATQHPSYHPGKCACVLLDDTQIGVLGELHPLARKHYELPETPLMIADLNIEAILAAVPTRYEIQSIPSQPPVLEDLAVVVHETLPAERVLEVIRQAGGKTLSDVHLFDVYRGDQIGEGKKSLAYSLTYQDPTRTLTDDEVSKIRARIIRQLEQELGAKLRS
ncbi:MAG: phenylalanine--tRNA ligase subunit beta [Chloroflexota bacterium]